MNCHQYAGQVDEYVDGTLTADAVPLLEAHLAGCALCRSMVADFAAIRAMARALEPHVPPAHVWQTLSAATTRRSPWRSFIDPLVAWRPAAATAMALLLGAGLWWVGDRLAIDRIPLAAVRSVPADAAVDVAGFAAEEQYTMAIARLEEAATTSGGVLDGQTAGVLDAGMMVIDDAIDESRAALETEPQSELVQGRLFQALRNKVALLQDTLVLINEARMEDPEIADTAPESRR
jgi:hypothetical protein